MQLPLLTSTLTFGLALGQSQGSAPPGHPWIPAGPDDFRGPCPMMNTLANHGYLQRDGRNITRENAIKGLGDGLNFNSSLVEIMFDAAIGANPEPNATYFTLEQLNVHNVLEHDASLSRSDAFFGNNHIFNESIFEETKRYWPDPVINASQLANAKVARQLTSKVTNPTYRFTVITEEFSLGEVIAPVVAFGDLDSITVNRTLVEYFFENERLPTPLGWSRTENIVSLDDIHRATEILRNATKLTTTDPDTSSVAKRRFIRDSHFGLMKP